jgi:hypothetical protein
MNPSPILSRKAMTWNIWLWGRVRVTTAPGLEALACDAGVSERVRVLGGLQSLIETCRNV